MSAHSEITDGSSRSDKARITESTDRRRQQRDVVHARNDIDHAGSQRLYTISEGQDKCGTEVVESLATRYDGAPIKRVIHDGKLKEGILRSRVLFAFSYPRITRT